jgi:hypothetical protein
MRWIVVGILVTIITAYVYGRHQDCFMHPNDEQIECH